MISLVKYVIRTFVLHVSITKPLGESGKLQLTSDMTELEFALSAFMVNSTQTNRRSGGDWTAVTEDYRALRAMRFVISCYLQKIYEIVIGRCCSWIMKCWRLRSTLQAWSL